MTNRQTITFEEWAAKLLPELNSAQLRHLWDSKTAPGVVFEGEFVTPKGEKETE